MTPDEIRALIQEALTTPLPEYLTTAQAAAYLGFSKQKLEAWRVCGEGPPFARLSARAIRYKRSDLDEWMGEHRCGSTSEYGEG